MANVLKNLCWKNKTITVCRSYAGFYIGTNDSYGPYCRLSEEYYKTQDKAQEALYTRNFTQRTSGETLFCNGNRADCFKCKLAKEV